MWTKTAKEIPEGEKETEVVLDDIRQREIAYALSEALEDFVGEQWRNLISGLDLTTEEQEWVNDNLRWTIINENTGEDLLHGEGR
jgi:hypothetical protein